MSKSNLIDKKKARPSSYKKEEDKGLLEMIQQIVKERPTYGYRRVTILLNGKRKNQGKALVNHKRIYRIMKQHQLLLRKSSKRPIREHRGKVETLYSNIRWCSDGFTIQCWNGDRVHVAFSLDSCDREVMGYIASTIGIDGEAIRDLMLETVEYRFGQAEVSHPVEWLSDNGSCYTGKRDSGFWQTARARD